MKSVSRKHPEQKMIQVNTKNILFIAGGAFDGIDKIVLEGKEGWCLHGIENLYPEIFRFALRKANATAEESIMIGDEMEVDIDGARAADIDQIFFNATGSTYKGSATFEVKSLLEIMKIL